MNPFQSRRGNRGFTLVELLVVMAIIGILAGLLLPVLTQGKARAQRAVCENNLSQMGIAFHSYGHDHGGKFPMAVSINDGGALEFVENGYQAGGVFYFGFHAFQSLSNELVRPQLLICPSDLARMATNFSVLQNRNVSYFFGGNADFLNANSILVGDRNLATNSIFQPTILQLGSGSRLRWTRELHLFKGNVLFADGHVEEWNSAKLKSAADSLSPANLFMPSVPQTNSNSSFGNSSSGAGNPGNANPNNSPNFPPRLPPSMNGNSGTPAPSSPRGNSYSPPMNASGNGNGLNRNLGTHSSQNLFFTNQVAQAAQTFQTNSTAADNSELAMSPLDQKIVRVARGAFEWSYLFLLLLLLLFLAYKLWQMLQRDKNRHRNDEFPPQS